MGKDNVGEHKMKLDSRKSIYLLLIILGGAVLLSVASLDPQAADALEVSSGSTTPEVFYRDESSGSEDGERFSSTAEAQAASGESRQTTPQPTVRAADGVRTTEEPVVTTPEPAVSTAEPELTRGSVTRRTDEDGSDRETDVDRYSRRLYDSQDSRTPAGVGECEWVVTFEDDFEGDELDTDRWDTGYKAGVHEAQYYVEDAFELKDGILRIKAEERQVRDREYASGILTTQGIFDQRYGRFQIRAKVPAGQGLWPAFWLLPSSENYPLEIDVFEILGHKPDTVYMTNHWRDEESGSSTFHTRGFQGPDFSKEFHTIEIIWKPGEIVWFVNGVERAREIRGVPDEPMFLLLNLAVGGKWPGYPDDTTPFPSYLEVDYVRVYEWTCLEGAGE